MARDKASWVLDLLLRRAPHGWPLYNRTDLVIDQRAIRQYGIAVPFGMTIREAGTVIYIQHEMATPDSGRSAMVQLLRDTLAVYAGEPLYHYWWTGSEWRDVTAEQLTDALQQMYRGVVMIPG